MTVLAEPIPLITEKDSYIIKGLIRSINSSVKDNPILYDKPRKIMDMYQAHLVYEHGMKILQPLYEMIDECPTVCIILAGGLIKLGVARKFYREENRGDILKMIQEYKDFYIEHTIENLIKSVEKETDDSTMIISRIKHKDVQEILSYDLRLLIYPIYSLIDKYPITCLSIIYELIAKEKLIRIFNKDDYGNKRAMIEKFKDFYINNRVKYLIERIAANPDISTTFKNNSLEKREAIEEIMKIGDKSLQAIYEIIDDYQTTCLNMIAILVRPAPFTFKNFGIDATGKTHYNMLGMIQDFKHWYKNEHKHIHSEPVI